MRFAAGYLFFTLNPIQSWLEWFPDCLDRAFGGAEQTLSTVLAKAHFWDRHSEVALNDRQRTMINQLLNGFVGKLNTSKWAKMAKTSNDTALRDIQDLVEKGILARDEGDGRSTSYSLGTRHPLAEVLASGYA